MQETMFEMNGTHILIDSFIDLEYKFDRKYSYFSDGKDDDGKWVWIPFLILLEKSSEYFMKIKLSFFFTFN